MRDLARRLMAASRCASDADVPEPMRVVERLRTALTKVVGTDGFAALLRRALALAGAEIQFLQGFKLNAEGRLERLEGIAAGLGGVKDVESAEREAALAITTHLLELLVTFIGVSLTLVVVSEAWPDVALGRGDGEH